MFLNFLRFTASALSCSLLITGICLVQTTERVNVDSLGTQANNSTAHCAISSDGRYVAFSSLATNLVPGFNSGMMNIFVHDRQTGITTCVSEDSLGFQGNGWSHYPGISADGRYVVFESDANNLVAGNTNGWRDIYVHDRQTDVTERVSVDPLGVEGDRESSGSAISTDGRYVAFGSKAKNLVPGETTYDEDIFVRDRQTGVTERVSVDSLGVKGDNDSSFPTISSDGRYVAFQSKATNLVPGDTNATTDIFVHDRQTGVTERVSVDSLGVQGNSISFGSLPPYISADGRYVTFESGADNLVPGDTNSKSDIFVHDRQTGVTDRVSVDSLGVEGNGTGYSNGASISADGRHVTFSSSAPNLVPNDNHNMDAFVHDRLTGVTERVSVNSRGARGRTIFPNAPSNSLAISADGRLVAFRSDASNFAPGDTNGFADIFVHDRWNGLGTNSIFLTGPSSSPVLIPVDFSWQTTRGNSQYWLAYSTNISGTILGGHHFDIGNPVTVLTTGTNSANGLGNFTTTPVPLSASGLTIYFEVAAQDAGSILYDSNVLAVTFY